MKNNKLTRKRSERLASKLGVTVQHDGTEVIHSKEARVKMRRWSFEADIEIVFPAPTNEDGTPKLGEDGLPLPEVKGISRTMKLEAISYSNTKEARDDCRNHEAYLRGTNALFAKSNIRVRAIPHETVSHETIRQLTGYRDMSMILDRALDIAVREAADVVTGKSVGAQFIEKAEIPAVGETPAVPAVTVLNIKEGFYKRAAKEMQTQETPVSKSESAVVITDSEEVGRAPFIPEIIEVGSTSEADVSAADGVVLSS